MCLKFRTEDFETILPPFVACFNALINLSDLEDIQAIADEQEIYKMIWLELETLSNSNQVDDWKVDPDIMVEYFNKMQEEAIPDYTTAAIVPGKLQTISFDTDKSTDTSKISKATESVLNTAGGSEILNGSTISGAEAFRSAQIANTEFAISSLLPQTQAIVNRLLSYRVSNPCRVKFFPVSAFTKKQFKDDMLKGAEYGLPTKLYNEKLLQIKQYLEEIEKLTFDGIFNGDTKDIETLVRLEGEIAKIEKELKSDKKFKPINEAKRTHDYERIQSWLSGNDSAPKHIREEIRQIGKAIYDVDNQADLDNLMSNFNELKAEVEATGKTGDSFATSWKKKMGQLGTYLASFGSFYQVINVLKKGLQTIREYNTVLTEMRKVSNENLKTLQAYQVETFDVADEVGTTSKTIQKSTADWMRLGEAIDEASGLHRSKGY